MTQAPYLAEITEAGCAVPAPGLDATLTVWPAGVPRCGLAETLGIGEAELLAFMFGRDAPACSLSCAGPEAPLAPVPGPAGGLLLASVLLAALAAKAVAALVEFTQPRAARSQSPKTLAERGGAFSSLCPAAPDARAEGSLSLARPQPGEGGSGRPGSHSEIRVASRGCLSGGRPDVNLPVGCCPGASAPGAFPGRRA